jgi:hypothetical protein
MGKILEMEADLPVGACRYVWLVACVAKNVPLAVVANHHRGTDYRCLAEDREKNLGGIEMAKGGKAEIALLSARGDGVSGVGCSHNTMQLHCFGS